MADAEPVDHGVARDRHPDGIRASTAGEALSQHLRAGTLAPGDVCVGISHTGESRDTTEARVIASHQY